MSIGKSQPQISQEMAAKLTEDAQQPDADVSNGTVTRDLLDVVATELSNAYVELETARQNASLKNTDAISADAMSQIAIQNYAVLRTPATYAAGTVTFQARSLPASDVVIPAGTIIQTRELIDGTKIQYTTDSVVTLATTATLNSLTGFYEVDAAVTASAAGVDSHVGVNSLTELYNPIAGVNTLTNKSAINNAVDQEDNEDMAGKILEKTAGSQLGTATGYQALILAQFPNYVSAVKLIGPLDSDNLRVQFGNEVDVSVVTLDATTYSMNALSFTATLTTNGTDNTRFTINRPVLTVTSVVGTTSGRNYVSNTDYGFSHDTAVVYGYSTQSFDGLCWFGQAPGPGLQLSVQGTYNKIVRDVQEYLDDPNRKYITGDLLVKEAQKIQIDIAASVTADSGVDRTQLETDIETALVSALNDYELGDDVLEDDIINTIQNVSGVLAVGVPLTTLKKSTEASGSDTVTILKTEYARTGTMTISVS